MLVVITDYQYDNIDAERRIIGEAGFELRDYQVKETKELIPLVKEADAIVTQYSDVSREVIGQLEHCKMIIKYGIGVNNIDTKAATEKGKMCIRDRNRDAVRKLISHVFPAAETDQAFAMATEASKAMKISIAL